VTEAAKAVDVSPVGALGWTDLLNRGIAAFPGPVWIAYLGIFLALSLFNQAARWAAGVPVGTVEPIRVVEASFPVLILIGLAGLDAVAIRAVAQIRPALAIDEAAVARLARDLTRTPATWALVAALAGLVEAAVSILTGPTNYGIDASSPAIVWIAAFVISAAATSLAFTFIAHAVHQLRIVTRVHRDLAVVDIFRLDPLYAFASLTSWTGSSLLLFGLYGIGFLFVIEGSQLAPIDLATVAGLCAAAVALFVVPLIGLHGRIQAEKATQRAAAGASMAAAIAELHRRMQSGEFVNSKEVSDAIAAATSAYTTISRIPTWPWRQETLRGFLGAVALPILIWSVTAILGRVI